MVNYYEKLFTADSTLQQDFSILDGFTWSLLFSDQNALLTATPSAEDIRDAIFSLDPDSSLGPDNFGGCFYYKCWDIIFLDVQNVIIHIFSTLDLPHGLNSSFVTLIPKVEHSIRVTDFRPIVMGNFIYKVFRKIIASRLGSFIG